MSQMRIRTLLSLAIPLLSAGLFVRLGLWQVDRHGERAAINHGLAASLAAEPIPLGPALLADTVDRRFARVTATGRFRYDLEQVLAGRTNDGSPGVHLLTPLELPGYDTLVVVTRGWVYSPDAAAVELGRWREADAVTLSGYLLPLAPIGTPAPADRAVPLRSADRTALASRIGRPVAPVQIVMTSDSLARLDSIPRRLRPPALDPGPHRSYAIQWFAFALIAGIGGVVLFRRGLAADRAAEAVSEAAHRG